MKEEEWREIREKQEEERWRGKETGRKDGQDERKNGRRRPFLTLNNDTTIGLCFLLSAD